MHWVGEFNVEQVSCETPSPVSRAQQRPFSSVPVPPDEHEVFKRFLYSFAFLV